MHEELAPTLEKWAVEELLDDMMMAEAAVQ